MNSLKEIAVIKMSIPAIPMAGTSAARLDDLPIHIHVTVIAGPISIATSKYIRTVLSFLFIVTYLSLGFACSIRRQNNMPYHRLCQRFRWCILTVLLKSTVCNIMNSNGWGLQHLQEELSVNKNRMQVRRISKVLGAQAQSERDPKPETSY